MPSGPNTVEKLHSFQPTSHSTVDTASCSLTSPSTTHHTTQRLISVWSNVRFSKPASVLSCANGVLLIYHTIHTTMKTDCGQYLTFNTTILTHCDLWLYQTIIFPYKLKCTNSLAYDKQKQ